VDNCARAHIQSMIHSNWQRMRAANTSRVWAFVWVYERRSTATPVLYLWRAAPCLRPTRCWLSSAIIARPRWDCGFLAANCGRPGQDAYGDLSRPTWLWILGQTASEVYTHASRRRSGGGASGDRYDDLARRRRPLVRRGYRHVAPGQRRGTREAARARRDTVSFTALPSAARAA
jgi:hypothetical protein